jgi:hypothetical protein
MTVAKWKTGLAAAVLAGTIGIAAPASAGTGCNGVINIFVWGCAPWDNNNGPQYPYYKKRQVSVQAPRGSKITIKDGHAVVTINGRNYPVVGGASGVVSAGGGNVVAAGGGNVVAAGGMNLRVWDGQ